MSCSVYKELGSWNLTCTLPAGYTPLSFSVKYCLPENLFFVLVMPLNINELLTVQSALLTNSLQLNITIWHFVDWHVRVLFELLDCGAPGSVHLTEFFKANLSFLSFFLFSHLLIDELRAFLLYELILQCVK